VCGFRRSPRTPPAPPGPRSSFKDTEERALHQSVVSFRDLLALVVEAVTAFDAS